MQRVFLSRALRPLTAWDVGCPAAVAAGAAALPRVLAGGTRLEPARQARSFSTAQSATELSGAVFDELEKEEPEKAAGDEGPAPKQGPLALYKEGLAAGMYREVGTRMPACRWLLEPPRIVNPISCSRVLVDGWLGDSSLHAGAAAPRSPRTRALLAPVSQTHPTRMPWLQDARQALTARKLQRVFEDVWDFLGLDPGRSNRRGRGLTLVHAAEPASAKPRGWLSGLFGGGSHAAAAPQLAARPTPRGLYMYGGVGVGKTMLMDLLVQSAPPEFQASIMRAFIGWRSGFF